MVLFYLYLLLGPTALLAVNVPQEWQELQTEVYQKLHVGCFRDKPETRDLPHLVSSNNNETSVLSCIRQCREQNFRFAGLQKGTECYCGNNAVRLHDGALDCNIRCPGNSDFTCGGATSNDIYHVSTDDKYLGCYNESSVQRDLPFWQWDASAGHSASDCIHTCSVKNYRYAGVQNGGTCYCGNEYGRHGAAKEEKCGGRCAAWASQNCGGQEANAIYRTEKVGDLSDLDEADHFSTRLWDKSGQITGIPTTLFTLFPTLKTVLSPKIIIHTSTPVQAPVEDPSCANNCYETCGDIHQEEDLTTRSSDVTLRFFHLKLSEISSYVGSNAKRVFVYAQTIIIDESVDFPFSILLRTKQMFIDRSQALNIHVKSEGQAFDLDIEAERFNDIEPNLMQQKMALTCARILRDTQKEADQNLAFTVLRDIANTRSTIQETQAFSGTVRGLIGELTGIARSGVHFVPFYTKDHLSDVLETYYTEIDIYRKNYDEIRSVIDNTNAFLSYAEAMSQTYAETDVIEAELAYDAAITAVIRSNETYNRFRIFYEGSREVLDELKVEFEKGLKEKEGWDIARATIKFIAGIANIVVGAISFDKDEVADSTSPIIDDVTGLFDTAYNLANTIRQIDELSKIADRLMDDLEDISNTDYLRNLDDVEQTVALNVNIIRWRNLKNYGTSVLANPEILRVRGAANYHRQLLDVCNWGESLTKAMVERGELLRAAIDSRTILDAKRAQLVRLEEHIRQTREGIIPHNEVVLADITEQTYDVRMDLNKALIVFCQAYFYENMFTCSESYQPSFGGSLTDLLIKINAASLDNLLTGSAPSTVERELIIRNEDTNENCTENLKCPITYLKRNRMLYFEMPTSHPGLIDLDAYKVSEIRLNFTGIKTNNVNNPWVKVKIESSGEFDGRADNNVYSFITKATAATFEYNVITNHISVYADIAAPFRNLVQRITPFTTWVMSISPDRSSDINFEDVNQVAIRFRGSALDNETWKKKYYEAHPKLIQ